MFEEYVRKIFIPHYGAKNKSLDTELHKFETIIKYFNDACLWGISSDDNPKGNAENEPMTDRMNMSACSHGSSRR